MNRQSLLVILLLLLALNLSDLFVVGSAQDSQIFEGQQLILRPVGKGSYTELFDVEGLSGPYFSENWQYAEFADSKILRVHSQDGSATDTYELSDYDPSEVFGNIYSVEIVITYSSRGQKQGIAGAICIDGELYITEKHVITETIKKGTYRSILNYNPITAKSWTWEDIDNLEAGAKLFVGANSYGPDFDEVYVIVHYGLDVTIVTEPPGCNVTLNNVTINSGSDGATFTGLTPFTTCNVTVSKQYYYSKTETVFINDTSVQQTISLLPSHYKLSVITNPKDCKVLIDGVETTSMMVPENTTHKITVSKDFYYYSRDKIITIGNYNSTIQIILDPSPVPYILFGTIGVIVGIWIIFLFINKERIKKWIEKRKAEREAQRRKHLEEAERRRRLREKREMELRKKREEEERNKVNAIVDAIEAFKPFRKYNDEKSYQIDLARWLSRKFPEVKIEEAVGSTRPDIVINDIAIEIKGPTYDTDLQTIADKCLRYSQHYKKLIIVLFDVHANENRYSEWFEGMKERFPEIIVIKK